MRFAATAEGAATAEKAANLAPLQAKWFQLQKNSSVYVAGLPLDAQEAELVRVFTKCGVIKLDDERRPRVKVYRCVVCCDAALLDQSQVFANQGLTICCSAVRIIPCLCIGLNLLFNLSLAGELVCFSGCTCCVQAGTRTGQAKEMGW